MTVHTRSESFLLAYVGSEVNDCSYGYFIDDYLIIINTFDRNICTIYKYLISLSPTTQDYYFAVTIEKGVVFLHSNLLDKPATHNLPFPVRSFFFLEGGRGVSAVSQVFP